MKKLMLVALLSLPMAALAAQKPVPLSAENGALLANKKNGTTGAPAATPATAPAPATGPAATPASSEPAPAAEPAPAPAAN